MNYFSFEAERHDEAAEKWLATRSERQRFMNEMYYYLILVDAVVSFVAAGAVYWKNRFQIVGPLLGTAVLMLGLWAACFAQYFQPLSTAASLWWAKLTLSAAILFLPCFFHGICSLVGRAKGFRWWIVASYVSVFIVLVLIWGGFLVLGIKKSLYMDHYIRVNPKTFPLFGLEVVFWQAFCAGILTHSAVHSVGYKRTQLFYIILAWFVAFLTVNSILLPLEFNIHIPPVGFFLLPLDFALLAYVLAKARLADYNIVVARTLLHAVTLLVVAAISLLFIAGVTLLAPGFMGQSQVLFTLGLVMLIGVVLTLGLPRFLPRAERMMQERMFGNRYGYQDALSGLVRELSTLPTIDQVLSTVATTLHSQMQIARALILLQDPLSGDYKLQAESGLGPEDDADTLVLHEDAAVIKWLAEKRDELVRDEMVRRAPQRERELLEAEMNLLKVALCVPMILDGRLVGLVGLGEKLNHDMFFVSDLRLLETLATEVALAVKYRRIEDESFRKNRLVELGTIAAGVAHEIRNPLASIKTFAQLMPERVDDPEFRNEFGKLVLKDVDRITKVIESMLAFARPAQVNIKEQPANELVEEAILLVQPRLKAKHIELTRAFHGDPIIKVDKHQILQVLVNLLSNAADALHDRGKVRVSTGLTQLDVGAGGNGNRNFGVIEVSDNGPGIPATVRGRLFDPFFTTKKEGTGLGLSISQKIVRDHGGSITVSSVEGKGTTFQINLPVK